MHCAVSGPSTAPGTKGRDCPAVHGVRVLLLLRWQPIVTPDDRPMALRQLRTRWRRI
jgi:hypothetical protein